MCFRATEEEHRQNLDKPGPESEKKEPHWEQMVYIYIYSGLIGGVFLIALLRSMIFYHFCVKCSQKLHDNMFISIIKTSMRFFDTNPAGRILNR